MIGLSPDAIRDWPRLGRRALFRVAAGLTVSLSGGFAFSGEGRSQDTSSRIWSGFFNNDEVFGFVGRHSVKVGEPIPVMLSRKPGSAPVDGFLRFYRVGDYPFGRRAVWTSSTNSVPAYPVLRSAAALGVSWPAIIEVDTAEWEPGCYTADFHCVSRQEPYYDLIQAIVRPPRPSGSVLVKLSTNTWQAYNRFGGHSLYPDVEEPDADERGAMVSFDRPTPPTFFEYEAYLVRWIEALGRRSGFAVDYAANFDVHADQSLLDSYKLVVCGSHDEYWSAEEFDAFERRILYNGRNTIFFGANTAYWQVRYADVNGAPGSQDRGRQMICWKSLDDPIVSRATGGRALLGATARYRDGARRPENMLMGAAYQSWFQAQAGDGPRFSYEVQRIDLPFFQGTGLRVGDELAEVVGYEWDNRDPAGDGRRLWDQAHSSIPLLLLDSIQVLFSGHPVDRLGRPGLAEAVYFVSPAGAKVFNAGSIRWAWGLGRAGFEREAFQRFNENLVLHLMV